MTNSRLQSLQVNVNGQPLSVERYDNVIDARISTSLTAADQLTLRVRDPYFELLDSDAFPFDGNIEMSLPDVTDTMTPVFSGTIVGLEVEQGGSDRHELVVIGLDSRHVLARSGQVRTFIDRTVSDIVNQLGGDAGLQCRVGSFTTKFTNLIQSGSDFEFINRLAHWTGARWWVEGTTLHFQPDTAADAVELKWGTDLQTFSARSSSAAKPNQITARAWDPSQQQAVVATAQASADPDLGTTAPLAKKANDAAPGGQRVIGTAPFADRTEGEQLAGALMKAATSSVAFLEGRAVGVPALRAGHRVALSGVGTSLAGEWTTTEVEHVIGARRPYTTRFVCGGREGSGLVDLIQSPRDVIGPTRQMEPVVGTVSNTNDPMQLGRVKVKLPSFGDEVESPWARIASAGAGPSRGLLAIPQLSDEVLVVFELGSWRRPVVIGALWSSKVKPPPHADVVQSGKSEKAVMLQTVGGHVIELHEGQAGESYIRATLAGQKTELKLAGDSVVLKTDQTVSVEATKSITIKSTAGDITLDANNITVKAKQALNLEGLNVTAKASASMKLEANATADLKANGPLTVQSSAITSVKGSLLKLN